MNELLDATNELGDAAALRARLDRDGYVLLRGLIDPGVVEHVREDVLATLDRIGWLREGEPVPDARPSGKAQPEGVEPYEPYFEMYGEVQRLQRYHELAHDAALQAVLQDLFGEAVLTHPMKILRVGVTTPERWTTPSHQDFPIIDGTVDFLTAWIPLGPVDPALGGLKVLPGSHRAGRRTPLPAEGVGRVRVDVDEADERFCTTTYAPGDVLLFHSLTVHGALPNTKDEIRLSADFRYQALSQPVREVMMHPHYHGLIPDWDVLTEGWTSDHSWRTPDGVTFRELDDLAPVAPALISLDAS